MTLRRPTDPKVKLTFTTVSTADDLGRIPYRYPFVDIANYYALKTAGYFRHATTDVSTALGGSKVTNTEGKLGFQLPKTEKLILIAKKGATTEEKIVIKGSRRYNINDIEIALPAGSVGDLYEIDLFDFGLLLDGVDGEQGVIIQYKHTTVGLALVGRMA